MKLYRVGELFDLEPGFAFKSKEFTDFGIPVLKIKNVKANSVPLHSLSYVDESFLASRPTKIAKKGDLLITMSGNRHDGTKETWVGKVAEFRHDGSYFLNQRVGALRLKSDVAADTRCCGYFLSSDLYQNRFIAVATSSGGQANLSPEQILNETISLPPLRSQQSISSLLGALDDKIENNRQMNETLEEMARAIFKSWFVDFDPVHAKAAGNAPAHMDGDTAALFPSSFGDDGLPVGWELQKIEDVTTLLKRGIAPKYTDGGCVVINQKCIRNDSINFDLARRHNQKVKPLKDKELQLGDVLINSTGVGTLGRVATVRILVEPATVDSHVTIVRPNPIIVEPIILGILLERSAEKIADMGQGSTGQTELKPSFVGDIEIVLPSKDVQQVFKSVAGPLREKVVQNQSESQTLSELRDTLLPKLMSGEIRVADAEREVEAVV